MTVYKLSYRVTYYYIQYRPTAVRDYKNSSLSATQDAGVGLH